MGQLNGQPLAIPDLASGCTPRNLVEKVVQPGIGVGYLKPQCFINAVAPSLAFYNAPAPLGCDKSFAYPTASTCLAISAGIPSLAPGYSMSTFHWSKTHTFPRSPQLSTSSSKLNSSTYSTIRTLPRPWITSNPLVPTAHPFKASA